MESFIVSASPWLIAVLAIIVGIIFFKSAYSAHSRQQVKASENDRGTRIFEEREQQSEPDQEPDPESERQHDTDPKLQPEHKIFLSHSGAQKNFVEQLCEDLEGFHHFPFFDKREDSLPKGERFPQLIFQAARQCRVAVVVLSEEFFTRTKWPMLELDAFVKAQKERNGYPRILPLFFKITRAQCHESARRKRWLKVWRGWARDDSRIVMEDWVNALNVFGPINGLEYKAEGKVSYRKAARSAIIRLVPPDLQFDTTSLQGSERLCQVILNKFHEVEASIKYGVRVVGVYGVGGLGKTTICKALCNTQFGKFDGRVCLAELGGLSREELQKQVLRELTQVNHELEKDLQGDKVVRLLKERMHKHKAFLAIDNVWDTPDSREAALTFLQVGFHCDSMILVTARTRDILLGMNIDARDCIEMPELDKEEATKLFLHHAIPHRPRLESAESDVVEQCVERCRFGKGGGGGGTWAFQYLPLAIKVLAGQLGASSDGPLDWRERMSNLNFNPSQDNVHPIFSILRTGFDSLSEAQQLLFMDVALFCPHPQLYTIVFEKDGFTSSNVFHWLTLLHHTTLEVTVDTLQILKRRSLLEDLGDGLSRITLHDLYYEFAINESQAMDFSKRQWLFADYETLSGFTGAVFPSTADVPEDLQQKPGLLCWSALRRIAICNSKLQSLGRSELQYCSNVVLLKLVNCPDLETVDLRDLGFLKFLEVDGCSKLKASSLGIEGMRKLVWLRWSDSSLKYPCFPNLSLSKSLQVLELTGDYFVWDQKSLLSNLPGLEDCVNLVELTLVGHMELLAFPDLSRMVLLRKVWFGKCKKALGLRGLSSKMTQLQELLLYHCEGIVELPGVEDLVSLKKLKLQHCRVTGSFPNLKKLTNLDTLVCDGFFLKKSRSMSDSANLEDLRCNKSDDLEELLDLSSLGALRSLDLSWCFMESLHECKISHLTNLQILKCEHIYQLAEVPDLSTLSQIKVISFLSCFRLRSVLDANIDCLTTLQSLDVSHTKISTLPDLSNLKDLRVFNFSYTSLTTLPKDFAWLATIPKLRMENCKFLRVPLLDLLGERVPEVQELVAMEALQSIYENIGLDHAEEGPHPSIATVSRLLQCLEFSANELRLKVLAMSLLPMMSFHFGWSTNRGFNTHVLNILGQTDGGVESVIKVFCEQEDAWSLFYVIVGFIFIGHPCSTLRATNTLHEISRKVLQFEKGDLLSPEKEFFVSVLHCLGVMFEDPIVASAFGDPVAIDFLERIKLGYVNHDPEDFRFGISRTIRSCSNLEAISEEARNNSVSFGHELKQFCLAKIDVLLDNARLASLSHGHFSEVVRLLKERMHKYKVFLAIDNVWDTPDSTEAALTLLQVGFHCESMVLVTARTRDILLRMNIDANACIEMPELDKEEATKLFLHHSIPQRQRLGSAEVDVVEQCVERCQFGKGGDGGGTCAFQYLPLAIKVLASELGASSDDPSDWRERMSNLNFNPSQDSGHRIFSVLRTGFDSLMEAQQLLFMDVALFCPHPKSPYIHRGNSGPPSGNVFHWLSLLHHTSLEVTMDNLQILKRRSLLEDLGDGLSRITLHDLYYKFAINESQAMDFSKRQWLFADYETLSKITGTVFPSTADVPEDLQQKPGLLCWSALRRIAICNSKLQSLGRSELQYCSNVVLLMLVNCSDLESMDLHDLGCLKFLEVDGCSKLKASSLGIECMRKLVWLRWSQSSLEYPCFPDLSLLKSLRVLELVGDFFGQDLTKSMLSSLRGLEDCVNLVELTLVGHRELLAFPDLSHMVLLRKLWFGRCVKASGLRGLSSKMTQLQELLLSGCKGIVELPGVEDLVSLKKLHLCECGVLVSFPNLKKLTNLDALICSGFKMKKSRSIRDPVYWDELQYNKSDDLGELLDLNSLGALQILNLLWCSMEGLHESKIRHLTSLQILKCEFIHELTEVPDLSTLFQIKVISFKGCLRLRSVLEANIDCLSTLQSLDVSHTTISRLPDLSNLKDLRVCDFSCTSLTALPKDFAWLATIPELTMLYCKFLRIPLLELLEERLPEVQELAAMEALQSIYESTDFDLCEEGPHPSATTVCRLLECLQLSANEPHLKVLAMSLLPMMSFQFGRSTNRGFNTNVLGILGQVNGGVESVIKVFCEQEDAWSLFYVIAGLIFIRHPCSTLRASNTLHQISRKVLQFEKGDPLSAKMKFFVSVLHCLGIMLEDPVVASAFRDPMAIDFLERIKLWYVNHDPQDFGSSISWTIKGCFNLGAIPEDTFNNPASFGHKLKQLSLAKIDALLDNARLASVVSWAFLQGW